MLSLNAPTYKMEKTARVIHTGCIQKPDPNGSEGMALYRYSLAQNWGVLSLPAFGGLGS